MTAVGVYGLFVKKKKGEPKKLFLLVASNLTAPVRVLLFLEEERVAGDVGR